MDERPDTRRARVKQAILSVRSAAIAGIVFSACSIVGIIRLVTPPGMSASDADLLAHWSADDAGAGIVLTMQLIFFAAAGFLWFIGVIRNRLVHEPKLFSTVFFGGGIAFVALLLVASAVLAVPAVIVEFGDRTPTVDVAVATRALGAILLADFGARVGALFIFTTSGLGRRTMTLPSWLVLIGYVVGIGLLFNTGFRVPLVYVAFPSWVAVVSVYLLFARPPGVEPPASPA